MKVEVSAPGKLILLGEYAVLEGAPALVAAVDHQARVSLEFNEDNFYLLRTPNLPDPEIKFRVNKNDQISFEGGFSTAGKKQLKYFLPAFDMAREYLRQSDKTLPSCTFTLDSYDFYLPGSNLKLGLGSSAAITVATLFAISQSVNYAFGKVPLFNLAVQVHQRAQGNSGSGVDIAASVFGGIRIYQKNSIIPTLISEPVVVNELNTVWMIPIWSGQPAVTEKFLQNLSVFKEKSGNSYRKIMQQMMELANSGCSFYQQGDVKNFMTVIQDYFGALDELGKASAIPIISQTHRHLAELVQKSGGVYKPSGAGGGDLGIAFGDSSGTNEKIREALDKNGYKIIPLKVANRGVHLWEGN